MIRNPSGRECVVLAESGAVAKRCPVPVPSAAQGGGFVPVPEDLHGLVKGVKFRIEDLLVRPHVQSILPVVLQSVPSSRARACGTPSPATVWLLLLLA